MNGNITYLSNFLSLFFFFFFFFFFFLIFSFFSSIIIQHTHQSQLIEWSKPKQKVKIMFKKSNISIKIQIRMTLLYALQFLILDFLSTVYLLKVKTNYKHSKVIILNLIFFFSSHNFLSNLASLRLKQIWLIINKFKSSSCTIFTSMTRFFIFFR